MKNIDLKAGTMCTLILAGTALTACDGDSRPFEEAVEIAELDLRSLTVIPPVIENRESILINPTQDLSLDVQGLNTAGAVIDLDASDREWSSSDTSVARVSNNGVVTGVGNGEATVSVTIGSLRSEPLTINVFQGALQSISSLVPLSGNSNVERCVGAEFYAEGMFDDGSSRPLHEATYTLSEGSENLGTVDETEDDTAVVSAYTLTPLGVVAAAGAAEPLLSELVVLDTLTGITVTSSDTEVDEDDTIQLTATGAYLGTGAATFPVADADGDTDTTSAARSLTITEGVLWSIASGESSASIDNTPGSEGELQGLAEGIAVAQASCGSEVAELSITVNEDTDSDDLAFNFDLDNDILLVSINETFQIEVTQGDDFDEDDVVTDDVTFTIVDFGDTATSIDTSSIDSGLVVPLTLGAEIEVLAQLFDDDDVIATGRFTIRITS